MIDMKGLTPQEFYLKEEYFFNDCGEIDYDEIYRCMQAYADRCEESAWVSVHERLPERWAGYPVTRNCLLFDGEEYLIGFYSYAHSQWETDDYAPIEGVAHWRPLPKPPKQ